MMAPEVRPRPEPEPAPHPRAAQSLHARVEAMLQLTDRRGYGIPIDDFARLLVGGPATPEAVAAAVRGLPEAALVDGLVVRRDRAALVPEMRARQAGHLEHVAEAKALADDFAGRLLASCPLARCVSVTGSIAAGGFDPRDDIDLNILTMDGSKYTVYLWSIILALTTSLRMRGKVVDEMGNLPLLPKVICVNVVWEDSQVRPFVRKDAWLAYELLMHRPLVGGPLWEAVLAENPWMAEHFPQVFESGFAAGDSKAAVSRASEPRAGRRFFAWLGRHPVALSLVERLSRFAVIGIHRAVSLTRTRRAEAREREAFVNLVKRPYSVYDVPGKSEDVPLKALAAR